MHDFLCSNPDDMKIPSIANRARVLKQETEGDGVMGQLFDEMREEWIGVGHDIGLRQGRDEGRAVGRNTTLFDLVGKGLLAKDVAAKELDLTPEEFTKRAAQAGYTFA